MQEAQARPPLPRATPLRYLAGGQRRWHIVEEPVELGTGPADIAGQHPRLGKLAQVHHPPGQLRPSLRTGGRRAVAERIRPLQTRARNGTDTPARTGDPQIHNLVL